MSLKLHIGGKEVREGWKILDIEDRPEVDILADAANLSQFESNSVDAIYASHVLEHFHHSLNNELICTLDEWHRVLKVGGKLFISVPDLHTLCWLYLNPNLIPIERLQLMRIMFGGQTNEFDVHKVGFDFELLGMYLEEVGFEEYEQVMEFNLFKDCSSLRLLDTLISLNVIATKTTATETEPEEIDESDGDDEVETESDED
ncbi:methyltransferase domain-containing protein [Geitlerinema sp. CS-897]|nr:methyltransferase domain-containing protein [Geitlerinema sp. CS-897]